MTYSLPFMVKVISPLLGIKRITGLTHFDLVSTLASSTFLIFQIIIDLFVTLAIILQGVMALATLIGLVLIGVLFFTLIHFEKEKHLAHDSSTQSENKS
mgnify:CR=1 FL=1